MDNVWFITGSSRGLGRSLTSAVLAAGQRVAATARRPEQLANLVAQYGDRILPLALDVTDKAQINKAVADALAHFSRLDVVVNNAGFGITGAAEGYTDEQVRSQLETNLYAPIAVTRAVLPHLRQQRSGHILQISSAGGRVGNPGVSIYQAAKFGIGGFSEALAQEVAPLGIRVTCVEPGGFRTDWAGESMTFAPEVPGYETTVGPRVAMFQNGTFEPMGDPDKAAQVLLALVENPEPPLHLLLGSEAVAIVEHVENARRAELEKWRPVSVSTDRDGIPNFLDTELGKAYLQRR
ncbi:SDR family oxidoreductase [Hymenobacter setariae]|uniref:SDR family oxidoreductase n=1 Tax=Hymenobacter setariae TaxID=2594794 RepID=A0A558BUC4_9BACT|nr:SDR family oxidoreductase [Hymenobacter setariae]TVT40089.1 SDR family oxidoreductase [Hymenobacter setariae]